MEQVIGEDFGVDGETEDVCIPECGEEDLTKPYCFEGSCVECIETPNCEAGTFCVSNICTPDCTPEDYSTTCSTYECGTHLNNCNEAVICLPNDCTPTGEVCGVDGGLSVGQCIECNVDLDCSGTDVCDSLVGACVPIEECTNDCSTFGYVCGTQTICGAPVDCSIEVGGCNPATESCNEATGQCELLCGNSVIDTGVGEECDDGNVIDGDGCSSSCIIEGGGWTCNGEPSVCQLCGNNIPEGTEACDDGNAIDEDLCRNDCTLNPPTDCSANCIGQGSSWGYCTSVSECGAQEGGTNPFSGNQFCGAGEGRCCCVP